MSYKEPAWLQWVKEFHELFDAYVGKTPHIPPQEVQALRVSLLQEELNELKEAFAQGDIVEMVDALTDLQYVLSGAVLACWVQEIFWDCFDEVHTSNMSKACKTREEAEKTAQWYKENKDTDAYIVEKKWVFLVHRVGDHKVLKSINYTPAHLQKIINNNV